MREIIADDIQYIKNIVTKKFKIAPTNLLFDDAISVGTEALLKARSNFDPSRGAKLKTVIYAYVSTAVLQFLRSRYAREFNHENIDDTEDIATIGTCFLDTLVNEEAVAEAINVIASFPEQDVKLFTEYILGKSHGKLMKEFDVAKSTLFYKVQKILDKVAECSQISKS